MKDIDVTIGNDVTMRGGASASAGRIDQYELVRELGGGGFGCVYLASDTVAGIEVAVKGLPPDVKHNKEELENIRANFALVSRLHHPNIAAALVLHPAVKAEYSSRDVMEKLRVFERDTMMVMEYAPGVTLSKWRKQFPEMRVPFEKALAIVRQVAAALDYAHGEKIVHRDVKPSNVMIETKPDGSVVARVLDFGLAAEIRSSMGRVSREIRDTSGTRPYMAPEQWRGAKQGPATDQYALAAMFCELVTGEVPFASVFDTGDPVVMLTNVTTLPPELPDSLPHGCRKPLLKALAKKPEERFEDCGALADALDGAGGGAFVGRALVAAALLVVLAVGALIGGGWWWHERVKHEELRMKNEALVAERVRKAGDTKTITLPGGVPMEMVWCPPGSFMMGSPTSDDPRDNDEVQHRVTLTQGFWMGEKEVTQGQWKSVMGTTIIDQARKALLDDTKYGGKTVREWLGKDKYDDPATVCGDIDDEVAMYFVSWEEANEFCEKFTARERAAGRLPDGWRYCLPTEAQWEYACRAGTDSPLPNGKQLKVLGQNNAPVLDDIAWYGGNSSVGFAGRGWDVAGWTEKQYSGGIAGPRKGGLKRKNRFGLYDIIGNVWEWCADWYGDYPAGAVSDPTGPASGTNRVLRGGSWSDLARHCRSALRGRGEPGLSGTLFGFRLVCSLPIAAAGC